MFAVARATRCSGAGVLDIEIIVEKFGRGDGAAVAGGGVGEVAAGGIAAPDCERTVARIMW